MTTRSFPMIASDDMLTQVGWVCATWSWAENLVESLIWGFLGIDDRDGDLVTRWLDMRRRYEMLAELTAGHVADPVDAAELTDCLAKLKVCAADRNLYIHGLWLRSEPDWQKTLLGTKRGRYRGRPQEVDAAKIRKLVDDLGEISHRLLTIGKKLGYL